ncbi:regulator of protease activity HflC (stomatin/prohibitin superfamily) [Tahibacter aquaticus]|uniref:Regulator of protease activity HflC (Stomatin/prohibitin superfamily) n=1 Tax=Tahibacter aquaticus TaxID=520092 RepID=A0A4R6YUQ5_9GAMM|nr:prohibitin family protein [Tahibacter aquaticus]TDR42082.1 regulator of protease activity HflC (stomatin/prohibitin superfamily) [Tahibacter aquaticus]
MSDETLPPLTASRESRVDTGVAAYLGVSKRRFRLWVSGLLAVLLLLLLWHRIFIPIGSGESGVLWSRLGDGTIMDRRYTEGYWMIWPWNRMAVYDLRYQEMHGKADVRTSDGLHVAMDVTIRYRPRADDLPMLHQAVGPRYRETVLWPDTIAALQQIVGGFKPEELTVSGETDLAQRVEALARSSIERRWVDLDRVLITRVTLPERVQVQIQEKLADEQKLLSANLKRQTWSIEAEGAREFQARSGTPLVKWRSIDALEKLAQSPNAKVVVLGGGKEMPFVLDAGSVETKGVEKQP